MPPVPRESPPVPSAIILAGGLALGAYQGGVLERVIDSGRVEIGAIAGNSIGAIAGAILAGNPPENRVEKLRTFWDAVGTDPLPFLPAFDDGGIARHFRNWLTVAANRLGGATNLFRPRWPGERESRHPCAGLYSAEPLRALLERLVDFDRLNDGGIRLCITACDVEAGETVLFDTAAGVRIAVDHLLASGSLIPAFSPTLLNDRLLVDGGFAWNAPLEPLLASDRERADWPLVLLVDLFSPDDAAPISLEASVARSTDLQFAMQTRVRLAGLIRERALEARLTPDRRGTDLFHLSYRPLPHEAGPEKTYDFSRLSIGDRWEQGRLDADCFLETLAGYAPPSAAGLRVHPVRRS